MPTQAIISGREAEERACRMLRSRGWQVVARNWIGGGGELDIVASRWKTLLIVEVRLRASGTGLASVDAAKLARTCAAANALVRSHKLQRYQLRIDVISFDGSGQHRWARDVLTIAANETTSA